MEILIEGAAVIVGLDAPSRASGVDSKSGGVAEMAAGNTSSSRRFAHSSSVGSGAAGAATSLPSSSTRRPNAAAFKSVLAVVERWASRKIGARVFVKLLLSEHVPQGQTMYRSAFSRSFSPRSSSAGGMDDEEDDEDGKEGARRNPTRFRTAQSSSYRAHNAGKITDDGQPTVSTPKRGSSKRKKAGSFCLCRVPSNCSVE